MGGGSVRNDGERVPGGKFIKNPCEECGISAFKMQEIKKEYGNKWFNWQKDYLDQEGKERNVRRELMDDEAMTNRRVRRRSELPITHDNMDGERQITPRGIITRGGGRMPERDVRYRGMPVAIVGNKFGMILKIP